MSYPPPSPPHQQPPPLMQVFPAPEWQRNFAVIFLILALAGDVAYAFHEKAVSNVSQQSELGLRVTADRIAALDDRGLAIAVVNLALLTVASVFIIIWLFAARGNAEGYEGGGFRRSRGWTIGSWFLPPVNLWFPYQCMADVWTASTPDREPNATFSALRPSWVVRLWWLTFLGNILLGWVNAGLYSSADTPADVRASFRVDYAATLVAIVAAGALVYVILTVTSFQRQRYLAVQAAAPLYPPRAG